MKATHAVYVDGTETFTGTLDECEDYYESDACQCEYVATIRDVASDTTVRKTVDGREILLNSEEAWTHGTY